MLHIPLPRRILESGGDVHELIQNPVENCVRFVGSLLHLRVQEYSLVVWRARQAPWPLPSPRALLSMSFAGN